MRSAFSFLMAAHVIFLPLLVSCSDTGQTELQRWMIEQRSQVRPSVLPVSESKKFTPQAYMEANSLDPFSIQKLTQALRRESDHAAHSALITPELSRRKEALEAFPLDTMVMVGSLNRSNQPVALVQAEKLLYQVKLGDRLGLNYGRVTRITETNLTLREIVQDISGDWIERMATLQLQEKSK